MNRRRADLVIMAIMDEHKGRSVAKQLNVRHIGTVGILMPAYDKGLIRSLDVKLCLDMMLAGGIRLDKKLCSIVLEHVGLLS